MGNVVYTVLVAYNPDSQCIKSAISSLLKQTAKVILVNNSNYALDYKFPPDKVEVIENGENLGIAAAQNIGIERAIEQGADYILQSDQDSVFPETMVFKLLEALDSISKQGIKVGIIGPNHYNDVNRIFYRRLESTVSKIKFNNARIVSETLSSGSLMSVNVLKTCGPLMESLFIDIVDWEYCWRMKTFGYKTIRLDTVAFSHLGGQGVKFIKGKKVAVIPSVIRHYYHTRNVIYLSAKCYVPLKWKFKELGKIFVKLFSVPFILDDGYQRFKMLLLGVVHGFKGKLGKYNN